MNKGDKRKLAAMRKRFDCDFSSCKNAFTADVLDTALEYVDNTKVKYMLTCTVCKKGYKVRQTQLEFFDKHVGRVSMQVRKSEFHNLFDTGSTDNEGTKD
jgi:transcription elongation factor Elf1